MVAPPIRRDVQRASTDHQTTTRTSPPTHQRATPAADPALHLVGHHSVSITIPLRSHMVRAHTHPMDLVREVRGQTHGATTATAAAIPIRSAGVTASISARRRTVYRDRERDPRMSMRKMLPALLLTVCLSGLWVSPLLAAELNPHLMRASAGKSSQIKLEGCKVSRKGRVTCTSDSYGPKVWNNGKARGYYWPKPKP